MTFSNFKAHSEPLFKKLDILKFKDNVSLYMIILKAICYQYFQES